MNSELDYLISLKQNILLRLKDLLNCNSSVKEIEEAKESYNLIMYNIELVKQKNGILAYKESTGVNIPIEAEDPYSSFVMYKPTEPSIVTTQGYTIPEHNYLLPQFKNNLGDVTMSKVYVNTYDTQRNNNVNLDMKKNIAVNFNPNTNTMYDNNYNENY